MKSPLASSSLRTELLAPARDGECGRAGIDCGADAVYIGAPRWGAREAVGNSVEEIAALVEYAHRFRGRVFVTLNTILRDDELAPAEALVRELADVGVDGLVVCDMGLLELPLPPLPLIASTQMHNDTPEKVAFLARVGFSRAILARELTLEEIRAIRTATSQPEGGGTAAPIELEVFVHGSLCVSYSGRCYLSYALGGRSANRGQCAQPCRKPWSVRDGGGIPVPCGPHPLSLKDLDLSAHYRDLLSAGVTAFKIEGRLKDRAYVMNAVAYHRSRLDEALAEKGMRRSSSGTSVAGFTSDPAKTFNRGFTPFFIKGRVPEMSSPRTPKMMGEEVARVTAVGRGRVWVEPLPGICLVPGDGVCFFDNAGELRGTGISTVEGIALIVENPQGIEPGTVLFRNRDHRYLTAVRNARSRRSIAVALHLAWRLEGEATSGEVPQIPRDSRIPGAPRAGGGNEELVLTAVDEDGVRAEVVLPGPFPRAEKPEQALATILRQLGRTGDSIFSCAGEFGKGSGIETSEVSARSELSHRSDQSQKLPEKPFAPGVSADLSPVPFLPVSSLNALRRDVLTALATAREKSRPRPVGGAVVNDFPYPESELSFRGNVLNRKAEAFYRRHGVTAIETAAESGLDNAGRPLKTIRFCLRYELGLCPRQKVEQKAGKAGTLGLSGSLGGVSVGPAPESSAGFPSCRPGGSTAGPPAGPWLLSDGQGHSLSLRFNCAACQMELFF